MRVRMEAWERASAETAKLPGRCVIRIGIDFRDKRPSPQPSPGVLGEGGKSARINHESYYARHKRTVNRVPTPGSVVKEIWPPWAWTMLWQMARPRPLPPASRERALSARKKRSKTWG